MVVSSAMGVQHVVLTPARRLRLMDFSDQNIDKMLLWDGKSLPKGVKKKEAFLDVDSPKGAFRKEELEAAVAQVLKSDDWKEKVERPLLDPSAEGMKALEDTSESHEGCGAGRKGRRGTDGSSPGKSTGPVPKGVDISKVSDGEGWYVVIGEGAVVSGAPVDLKGTGASVIGDIAIFAKGNTAAVAVWCTAESVTERIRQLRIRSSGYRAERFEGIDDIYRSKDGTPRGGKEDVKASDGDGDLRVLPCHYEKDGRRFRRLQEMEPEFDEEDFADWPLDGERTLSNSCRDLRRNDRSWSQHHTEWLRLSGGSVNDRSAHEHKSICTALHHLCTYDQVCAPNLAGAEALNARRELIEFAHKGNPQAPRWDASEEFLG